MGSEQIFKKSVLGGFKKEGVLDYVEQLQSEIINLKKEISNKSDFSKDVEVLKAASEEAAAETAALSAKNDALKAENEALSEKNSHLIQELEDARELISEYEEKQKIFEDKISAIENKFVQLTSGYTINGAASVNNTLKTNESIKNARSAVFDANENLKNACSDFEGSSSALKSCVENLLNVLSDISEQFNLCTDKEE